MTIAAQTVLPTPLAEERSGWPYITVLSKHGSSHRTEAETSFGLADSAFRWSISWGYSELAFLADEGRTWIRGWHEPDSSAVHALLTAFHLYKETQ